MSYKEKVDETIKGLNSLRTPLLSYLAKVQSRNDRSTSVKRNITNFANKKIWGMHVLSFLGEKYTSVCYNIDDFVNHNIFKITNVNENTTHDCTLNEIVFENEQPGYEVAVDIDEEGEVVYEDPIVALKFNDLTLAVKLKENGDIIQYGLFTRLIENGGLIDFHESVVVWDDGANWIVCYMDAGRGKRPKRKTKGKRRFN